VCSSREAGETALLSLETTDIIELTHGDILQAEADALVNTVNCVGVMGRGIALQFRKAYPENFKAYKKLCDNQGLRPGGMFVFDLNRLAPPHYVINFPTKRHWRGASRIEDIDSGLKALAAEVQRLGIRSIAVPPLGCGLGGLDWNDVRPRIEAAFRELPDVRVLLFSDTLGEKEIRLLLSSGVRRAGKAGRQTDAHCDNAYCNTYDNNGNQQFQQGKTFTLSHTLSPF